MIGNPGVIYYELLEDPKRFSSEAADLIQRLVSGATSFDKLTDQERVELNEATLAMFGTRHVPPPAPQVVAPAAAEQPDLLDGELEEVLSLEDFEDYLVDGFSEFSFGDPLPEELVLPPVEVELEEEPEWLSNRTRSPGS